jgi:Ferric iron reductase FhuF-like transporter
VADAKGGDSRPATAADWQSDLASRMGALGRWAEGRLVLETTSSIEMMPAVSLLEADTLRAAITQSSWSTFDLAPDAVQENADDIDLRIAVSRFTRHYCSAASVVALVALAHGVGLNLSASRCRLIFVHEIPFRLVLDVRPDDIVLCAERPTTLPVSGRIVQTVAELRSYVWRHLYANNIAPLFQQALDVTNVTPTLMWTNAAEWIAVVSDAADESLDSNASVPFVADRRAIMSVPELPGVSGPNPLLGLVDWFPVEASDFPHGVHERRICCLTYLLEDRRGRMCQNCPFLSRNDQMALIRERRGVAMGSPGGPAEERTREIGLTKVTRRQSR